LAWVIRHADWPDSRDLQPVDLTGDFCVSHLLSASACRQIHSPRASKSKPDAAVHQPGGPGRHEAGGGVSTHGIGRVKEIFHTEEDLASPGKRQGKGAPEIHVDEKKGSSVKVTL
jgi:hypothetical protein